MDFPTSTLAFALLGGIVPALFWLFFWLREDKRCPEPRGLITLAFFAGMMSVLLAIPLEQAVDYLFIGTTTIILGATIEEVLKFLFAYFSVLRNKAMDQPIDAVIYMITVALGFAALENTLFLFFQIGDELIAESIVTGNLRFVGATLLHTLASASVGIMIAFSLHRKKAIQRTYLITGLILASILHTLFNFFILKSEEGKGLFWTFFFTWIGIVGLIFFFEKIKQMQRKQRLFIKNK